MKLSCGVLAYLTNKEALNITTSHAPIREREKNYFVKPDELVSLIKKHFWNKVKFVKYYPLTEVKSHIKRTHLRPK